jgi:membrane fusion protein, multidrug efflux system
VKTDRIEKSFTAMPEVQRAPRRRWRRLVGVVIVLAIAVACVWFYAPQYLPEYLAQYAPAPSQNGQTGRNGRPGARGDQPVPVLVAVARAADVPVYFDGVGSSRALNTVTVRAQIDGKLMSVNFKEGQDVDHDFVLAEIDATIYQAQYDQAVAKKAMDEAQLANARLDLERYARLMQTNSATRQQHDTQRALVAQFEAQVQADQGAIENAKAILSYTKIIAPLAGRTGIRQVDAGNIVHAADTTGIVVITQVKPIAVIFMLPQQQLARVNKALARGPLDVQALGDDNRSVVDSGTLQVIDNQVDQTTGTVKLKAEFPNADLQLWPGQFVNVKLRVDTLRQVVVVPSASVQRGPNGSFVYVANDGAVTVHPVTVGQQDDTQAVILEGIEDGAQVVTTGFAQLTDGAKITIGTQENLERPAGSERRRGPPRGTPAAQSEPTPRTGAVAAQPSAVAAQPAAATPDTAATPAAEPARNNPQRRTQSGGTTTATP